MGLTAVGTSSDVNQRILKNIFGVRIQQVAGYPGSAEERLAIERGELDGDCGAWSSIPSDWIEARKIVPILRSAPFEPPDLPAGVPYSVDIAPSAREREIIRLLVASGQVGRPFIASAAVPAERMRILRDAFDATIRTRTSSPKRKSCACRCRQRPARRRCKPSRTSTPRPDDIVQAARKIASE